MKRVLIVALQQEVSSFNPVPSTRADFAFHRGEAMRAAFDGTNTYAGGALEVLDAAPEVAPVPVYSALACSAGTLAAADWQAIRAELLDAVRAAAADGVDGVLFLLHGAMSAEGETDPEGDVLEAVRRIVGDGPAFAMSMDLHGILTARMLAACPAMAALRTYPHVDFADAGARAARLLLAQLEGRLRPVAARLRVPMLVRGDQCITETGIYGRFIARADAAAGADGIVSAQVMIGNPFTDVPELCSQVVAVANGDTDAAERAVRRIAEGFFDQRAAMQADLASLDDAVIHARNGRLPLILKDAADAPSSGGSGDSVEVLRTLLAAGIEATILAPVVDAPAVRAAGAAGVGATARFSLGGTCDPRFAALRIEARVAMLSDGRYRMETWGVPEDAGPCAKMRAGNVTIIATSKPVQLFDRSLFLAHGEHPQAHDINIVKSPHCQPRFYDDWARTVVSVDAKGATSARVETLGHTVCQRPLYPLDDIATFAPVVEIYR
ncbi:M81 family metallopeptidase [Halovulum marinum]|uniref:M81 family metallopeptidase n=1 Tax=Halovulum marinum TaxID=2662447 RepID=UPI002D764F46|nr:M81 family metallopeptidase [Halovulum marinum]